MGMWGILLFDMDNIVCHHAFVLLHDNGYSKIHASYKRSFAIVHPNSLLKNIFKLWALKKCDLIQNIKSEINFIPGLWNFTSRFESLLKMFHAQNMSKIDSQ